MLTKKQAYSLAHYLKDNMAHNLYHCVTEWDAQSIKNVITEWMKEDIKSRSEKNLDNNYETFESWDGEGN